MKFKHIEVFKAIMDTGTVTAASERLFVSQPAISQTLQTFEDSLGFKLFERVKGRLLPTTEANLLLEEVNRVYKGMDYLDEYVDGLKQYQSRLLEVGVYPALIGKRLSQCFAKFIDNHPNVTVTIRDFTSVQVLKYTRSQQIDLGLSAIPTDDPAVNCSLLISNPMSCIVPKSHPLSKKDIIHADDLDNQDFISFSNLDNTKSVINNFLEENNVKPKTIMQASLASSVCHLVAEGLGIALIDNSSATEYMHLPIANIPFKSDISSQCYLVKPSSGRTSALADAFIEHMKNSLTN